MYGTNPIIITSAKFEWSFKNHLLQVYWFLSIPINIYNIDTFLRLPYSYRWLMSSKIITICVITKLLLCNDFFIFLRIFSHQYYLPLFFIHRILFLAHFIKLCTRIEFHHIKCQQLSLFNVLLHARLFINQPINYIFISICFFSCSY